MTREEAITILTASDYFWLRPSENEAEALNMAIGALEKESLPCDIPKNFGVFIPEITVDEFRNAPLESIEDLLAMGEFHDIDLSGYQEPKRGKWMDVEDQLGMQCSECGKMCSEITLRTDMMTKAHWNYCPNCGCAMDRSDTE